MYYEEDDEGRFKFNEKPEIRVESLMFAIHPNVTINENGQVNERKLVEKRYKLYSQRWF